jgi:hypothetical protein
LLISEKATELLATSDWPRFAALSTGIRRLYYHKREREGERERGRERESPREYGFAFRTCAYTNYSLEREREGLWMSNIRVRLFRKLAF